MGSELHVPFPDRVISKLEKQGKEVKSPEVLQELYEGVFERIKRAHPLDYYWLWTHEGWTWKRTKSEEIEETTVELKAALAAAKKVKPPFTLGTSGWVLGPASDRSLFDKILGKGMFVSCINRNLGASPIDPAFASVRNRPKWAIPWLEDDKAMNLPQLWVGRMRKDAVDALDYGCTGLFGIHWRTRILGPNISALAQAGWTQSNFRKPEHPERNVDGAKHPVTVTGGSVASFSQNIQGTNLQPVYQTVRYGNMAYRISLPNKDYRVILQMVEPAYRQSKHIINLSVC
jgi:hypothetical protein